MTDNNKEARLRASDEREITYMHERFQKKLEKDVNERLKLRLSNPQFITGQILGAVDRNYSCTFWGHHWDYDFYTYDKTKKLKKKPCAFCGRT